MGLSNRTILNIIELVFYGPALLCAVWIIKKHGMGRQSGWIYIAILAVLRIVGASTGIAANSHPSQGLIETSDIAYSVGLSPLFFAWLGIIKRVNEGLRLHVLPPKLIDLVYLPILAGLILAILGGTKLFDTNTASVNTGVTCVKIGVMLLLVAMIALSAISVFTFTQIRHVMDGEKHLLVASLVVIPFLLVRIIYSIIVDFDLSSTVFSLTSDRNIAVVVQAVMSVAMELIVVSIFLTVGFATPAIPRSKLQSGQSMKGPEQEPQQRYGGGPSHDNSPNATYLLTDAQISHKGYNGGQEDGVTGDHSDQNRVQYSA